MGSHNIKLKRIYINKINKYEKLIIDTVEEVKRHKTISLNYIKGMIESYNNLYKNYKFDSNDDNYENIS